MRPAGRQWGLIIVVLFIWGMMAPLTAPVQAADSNNVNQAWEKACSFAAAHPQVMNTFFSPWLYALALGCQGQPSAAAVNVRIDTNSPLTIARSIIGLIGRGDDPTQVQIDGTVHNLITELAAMQNNTTGIFGSVQGTLNHTIWSVIALDLYQNQHPGIQPVYNSSLAVEYIKSQQLAGGGQQGAFNEGGYEPDADSTAHALIALSNHVSADDNAVIAGLTYLKSKQLDNGAIDCNYGDSPASTAAVIEALLALGIDPQGAAWTENGNTLIDGLLIHQQPDGSFIETMGQYTIDNTAYALCALADLASGQSKYKSQFPQVSQNDILTVTASNAIRSGQDCDLTVQVENPGLTTQDTLVIAALYNPEGRMITYSYGQYRLNPGAVQQIGLGFAINAPAGSLIKVMAWDSWQNRHPLASPVVLTVGQ